MNYTLFDFLTLVGSLGMFLYGMKMMSESLQRVAGSKMRSILSAMTSNRFFGLLTGIFVTIVVQSSTATTVMLVGFVNAGLITLKESIGVIMGANIGTTFTGWMISVFGFKFQISDYSLPMIAIGIPLIFSKAMVRRSWGEFLVGFALLFLGLDFMKDSVPNIRENPEIMAFVEGFSDLGFGSILIFLMIGTLLTVVIQSSSATMALTFVMISQGWIEFQFAAAMVLGENIGTTITANIAASVGNISAKRAARIHFIINVLGILWMLMVFNSFADAILRFVTSPGGMGMDSAAAIPTALALFHTVFNVLNVSIFIWFTPLLQKIVVKLVPQKVKDSEEEFRLKYITTGMLSTPELSLLQAKKEVQFFAKHSTKMFGFFRKMLKEPTDKKYNKLLTKVQKYEGICDNVEVEITNYLSQISQYKMSVNGQQRMRSMLKLVGDLESIGDCNFNLARSVNRMREKKITFNEEAMQKLELMFNLVEESLEIMRENLDKDESNINLGKAMQVEEQINNYRNQLKAEHLDNLSKEVYSYEAGILFNDIFSECEKLGDYAINVSEALTESASRRAMK
ncbi:Na/Pi cotransporter family protein [Alkalitalea saponilacus]|uniref:Phosphate:Na+ symporter n=1 Tax=Alkalitalea saponilacus TaxID=889453 RepID=A0A1T5A2W8_9BACT|nr:Na/Pi cotransporter family protein [Alkalitalea saponilacus]ASB48882.1 Na/Pi cotransporter [Alkalitalea saponilacus]SKB29342.1 phosphate:Na+ symporter [Alkalitalea saponilacus]